jgi:hypothetical protein
VRPSDRLSISIATLALATAGALPVAAGAQDASLAVEVLGGGAVPVASFASGDAVGEGTDTGASLGVRFTMTGQGRRTTYLGFGQHRFGCVAAGCPTDGSYVATGVEAGFRIKLLQRGSVLPWVSLGGLTTRVESPGLPQSPSGVSSLGYGGEAGAGLYIGAGHAVAVNPQVRFATVGVDLPGQRRLTLRYVVATVGLVLAF